jgi:hypothetical protein
MCKPKYIETPERMWELFEAYGSQVKGTPILVQDFVGKDGDEVNRKKERPLTMEGFYNYLDTADIITDATDYFENKDDRYNEYVRICSRISRTIRQDQIEGGMAGIYNPSITQRLNGLVDKKETNNLNERLVLIEREPNPQDEPIG